jgi:hypothetical protein
MRQRDHEFTALSAIELTPDVGNQKVHQVGWTLVWMQGGLRLLGHHHGEVSVAASGYSVLSGVSSF